jgi:hypothetical protein
MSIIYAKTPKGQATLQNRSVALSPRQRSAFILFDGKRTYDDVLRMTVGLHVTQADIDYLLEQNLLAMSGTALNVMPPTISTKTDLQYSAPLRTAATLSVVETQERYLKAYPIATRLTSDLGLRGFRLNLAVEAAGSFQKLCDLAPKIKDAVGPEKFKELENALR